MKIFIGLLPIFGLLLIRLSVADYEIYSVRGSKGNMCVTIRTWTTMIVESDLKELQEPKEEVWISALTKFDEMGMKPGQFSILQYYEELSGSNMTYEKVKEMEEMLRKYVLEELMQTAGASQAVLTQQDNHPELPRVVTLSYNVTS